MLVDGSYFMSIVDECAAERLSFVAGYAVIFLYVYYASGFGILYIGDVA